MDLELEMTQRDRIRQLTRDTPGYVHGAEYNCCREQAEKLLCRLFEEGGEIAGAVKSHFGRALRPEVKGSADEVRGEIGDALVIIYKLCDLYSIAPHKAIDLALNKYENRLNSLKQ